MEKVVAEAAELPLANVRRVVKDKLSDCSPDVDIVIHKEALMALSESARIFIHYLSATASDICKESKRQTITADDVSKALEEIEFSQLIEDFNSSVDESKQKKAGKKGAASSSKKEVKKRKAEETVEEKKKKKKKGKSKKDEGTKEDEEDKEKKDEVTRSQDELQSI